MSDDHEPNSISIEETRKKLMEGNISVQDTSVFSPDHVPENILHRTEHNNKIIMRLRGFIKDGGNTQLHLTGDNSTGKTLILKWWNQTIDQMLDDTEKVYYMYFNCGNVSSWQEYCIRIAERFDVDGVHRGQGPDKVMSNILNGLDSDAKYVFALDEFDKMTENSRSKIVKLVTRSSETNGVEGEVPNMMTLFSTNNAAAISELDRGRNDRTHTVAANDTLVKFGEYSKDELADIFRQRFKEGLAEDAWDEELVEYVAKRVKEKLMGDLRFGLKAIQQAMEIVLEKDHDCVEQAHIDNAINSKLKNKLEADLDDIQNKRKYKTLLALATIPDDEKPTTKKVLQRYKKVSHDTDHIHINTVRKHLKDMCEIEVLQRFNAGKHKYVYKFTEPYDKKTAIRAICSKIGEDPTNYDNYMCVEDDEEEFRDEAEEVIGMHMSAQDTQDTKTSTPRGKTQKTEVK